MTKAEREMMKRIYAYGVILSLDEEKTKLVTAKIKELLASQKGEQAGE